MTGGKTLSLATVVLMSWILLESTQASVIDQTVRKAFSSNVVTSMLMTDDEVVQLGLLDFNPNDYINIDDEDLGTEESSELRSSLKSINLPLRYDFDSAVDHNFFIGVKLAFLAHEQEVTFANQPASQADDFNEKTTLLGVGAGYSKMIGKHWELELSFFLNWLHYNNDIDFNSDASIAVAPVLDSFLTNVSFDALLAEPSASFKYHIDWGQTHFTLFSTTHYLDGAVVDADRESLQAKPEAWYMTNGVLAKRPFSAVFLQGHSLWYRIAQINTGGDLSGSLGTDKYYEAGIAWLVETPGISDYLENVGLGININYGSDLKGGTLIFLFNK